MIVAKTSLSGGGISLAPGFSPVLARRMNASRFNGFSA